MTEHDCGFEGCTTCIHFDTDDGWCALCSHGDHQCHYIQNEDKDIRGNPEGTLYYTIIKCADCGAPLKARYITAHEIEPWELCLDCQDAEPLHRPEPTKTQTRLF